MVVRISQICGVGEHHGGEVRAPIRRVVRAVGIGEPAPHPREGEHLEFRDVSFHRRDHQIPEIGARGRADQSDEVSRVRGPDQPADPHRGALRAGCLGRVADHLEIHQGDDRALLAGLDALHVVKTAEHPRLFGREETESNGAVERGLGDRAGDLEGSRDSARVVVRPRRIEHGVVVSAEFHYLVGVLDPRSLGEEIHLGGLDRLELVAPRGLDDPRNRRLERLLAHRVPPPLEVSSQEIEHGAGALSIGGGAGTDRDDRLDMRAGGFGGDGRDRL